MIPKVTLRHALADDGLLAPTLGGETWAAWRALLIAAMGEPLEPDELAIFTTLTGRSQAPLERVEECYVVAGRRGGKTRAMAALACYIAGLCSHLDTLAAGERGVVLLIAPDQRQARVALDYCTGIFDGTPILRQLIAGRTSDTLSLTTGIDIEVRAASFRRLRGMTSVAVLADEACFWFSDDSANPDTEILNAARPSLASTGGPMIVISSPYAKRGEVFNVWRRHFGPDGDPAILVAQADSRTLNPSLSQRVIDRALERDRVAATAEYLAQFRADIESFVAIETVEACVERGVLERAPRHGVRYLAFVDPSGGSVDAMTLAVSHRDDERIIIDAVREVRPPFSPESVVESFAALLQSYRITRVCGDRFGGEWPRERFLKWGITYEPNAQPKSDLYRDLLPMLNAGSITLPDSPRLINQIASLERRTTRGGRDSIDHAPGAHDDLANCVAGAAALCGAPRNTVSSVEFYSEGGIFGPPLPKKARPEPRKAFPLGDGWSRIRR